MGGGGPVPVAGFGKLHRTRLYRGIVIRRRLPTSRHENSRDGPRGVFQTSDPDRRLRRIHPAIQDANFGELLFRRRDYCDCPPPCPLGQMIGYLGSWPVTVGRSPFS